MMTTFKLGNTLGKGRPKGAVNKFTRSTKEAFQYAFNCIGGVEHLTAWAKKHPGEFYRLYARLIPIDVSNDEQTPKKIKIVVVYQTRVKNPDVFETKAIENKNGG